jgi:deoxyribose-phosphate aldolase
LTADTNINYNSSVEAVNTAADYEIEVEKIPLTRIPLTELYLRAEEKIKAAGGMKTTEQAMKELKEEARVDYSKTVQKLAEEEPDIGLVPPTNEEG